MEKTTTVLLADDHVMLREALGQWISTFPGYQVLGHASSGLEVMRKMKSGTVPDILLLDVRMPVMDGVETMRQIKEAFPKVQVVVLSMCRDDQVVIRMIRGGAAAYLRKDSAPSELRDALDRVCAGMFHYNDVVSSAMHRSVVNDPETALKQFNLNPRQLEFLRLAATELTYKEVADRMHVSARTVDGYRDELFTKLGVRSRVGLVLFAIRNGFVEED